MPSPEIPDLLALPASSASTGEKRANDIRTPESAPTPKKARTTTNDDPAFDLALDHLHMDPTTHPLYDRNAAFVLDHVFEAGRIHSMIDDQFNSIPAAADTKKPGLDEWQYRILRRQLTLVLAKRMLEALAASLNATHHFVNMTKNLEIGQDGKDFKLSFTVKPVMQLDGDDVQAKGSVERARPAKNKEAEGDSSDSSDNSDDD